MHVSVARALVYVLENFAASVCGTPVVVELAIPCTMRRTSTDLYVLPRAKFDVLGKPRPNHHNAPCRAVPKVKRTQTLLSKKCERRRFSGPGQNGLCAAGGWLARHGLW
eukprot:3668210-Amphidinium_carterae.1